MPPNSNDDDYRSATSQAERRGQTAGHCLPRELDDASTLLCRHWPAVRALARALLERGQLSGPEAERIITDNLDHVTRARLAA